MNLQHKHRKVIFIEDYSLDVKKMEGSFIALTPRVCARLDREGIEYSIIEDFWDLKERKEYGEGYQIRFLQWINVFDEYLRKHMQDDMDMQLSFASLYGYYVSSFSDYNMSKIKGILKVFDALQPSEVYLFKKKEIEFSLFDVVLKELLEILKCVCLNKKISFDYEIVNSSENLSKTNIFKFKNNISKWLRVCKRNMIILKERIFSIRKRHLLKMKGSQKRILIINDDWLANFYKEVISQGHDVYYASEGSLKKSFSVMNMSMVSTKLDVDFKKKQFWQDISDKCFREFNPSKWFNDEAGMDVSCLFDGFFRYFLREVCPVISCSAKQYTKYFLQYGITHTICPYKVSPEEIGISAAASINSEVVAVQIEHGSTTANDPTFKFSEQPVDVYVTCSIDQKVAFENIFEKVNNSKAEVVCADVWLEKYTNIDNSCRKLKENEHMKIGKKKICYVPSAMPFYRFNYLYDPCWYYKIHKEIFSYFSNLKECEFIVKVDGSAAYHYEPIRALVEMIGSDNLIYKDDSLIDNYLRADMVIVDFAATCAFESRLLGIPTLELCCDSHAIFRSSKELYGKTLRTFKTVDDAIEFIDEFIKSEPLDFVVRMDDSLPIKKLVDVIC